MLITDGFRDYAQRHPDKLAVTLGSDRRTYSELLIASQKVANGIWPRLAETSPHLRRVGLLLNNSIEFLESFLGTVMAGGVAMILNPDWSPATLSYILEQWPPTLLITQTSYLPLLDCFSLTIPILTLDNDPSDANLIASSYRQWRDRQPAEWAAKSTLDTDPFYICFTSGTTGQPKGVIRHHRSWLKSIAASQAEFGTTATDQVFAPGALVHSLFLYTAIESLVVGATLHLLPKFNPRLAVAQLQQHAITVLVGVPILLSAIAKVAQSQSLSLPTIRMLISGGAKLEKGLHQQIPHLFPSAQCFEYYGATELSFISLWSSREAAPMQSVGRAFHGVELSIRREPDYSQAEIGEIGWIGVKSDMLSSGYLLSEQIPYSEILPTVQPIRPDTTGYRVVQGWATVGDRGWLDENGYLYLVGREQDMINSGGLKVYPAEVEAALHNLPEIESAVVFGVPDADRGDRICAVVQWAEMAHLSRRELQERLLVSLARHKCPQRFFAVDQWPLTTSGKIARNIVKDAVLQQPQSAGDFTLRIIL